MKRLVKVEEVEGAGLLGLMGERVTFFGLNYIYVGKLVGVNDKFCELEDASVVYETGAFDAKDWTDAQKLPSALFIMLNTVEAFTVIR